jgi:hypothetical protein
VDAVVVVVVDGPLAGAVVDAVVDVVEGEGDDVGAAGNVAAGADVGMGCVSAVVGRSINGVAGAGAEQGFENPAHTTASVLKHTLQSFVRRVVFVRFIAAPASRRR